MVFEQTFIAVVSVVIVILSFLLWRGFLKRREIARAAGFSENATKRNHIIRGISALLLTIFLAVGLLAPIIQDYDEITFRTGEVLFLVDESRSMAAEKRLGEGNRMERVREIMLEFSQAFENLNVSIYGFTREVRSHLFWTTDYNDFRKTIKSVVDIEAVPTTGTDLGKAIGRAANYFPEESHSKTIVLLSDGENRTSDYELEIALGSAYEKKVKIIVIGVGEREGASIPIYNQRGQFVGLEKVRGKEVITFLNEKLLEHAALRTEGVYVTEDSLEEAFQFLDKQLVEKKKRMFTEDTTLRKCFLVLSLIPLYFLITKNW